MKNCHNDNGNKFYILKLKSDDFFTSPFPFLNLNLWLSEPY